MSVPILSDAELAANLHAPADTDHKYTRGVVGVCAGSQTYPGAAVLAAGAAARTGVGMVRLLAPKRVQDLVLRAFPEVVPASGKYQSLVCGPGIDLADVERCQQVQTVLQQAKQESLPTVIDAGALPLLGECLLQGEACTPWQVLTPHTGEAAALLCQLRRRYCHGETPTREQVESSPAKYVQLLADLTGATVLLKGHQTLLAAPGGGIYSVQPGPAWLATAGSGDVLAGILGALLATARARDEQARQSTKPTGAPSQAGAPIMLAATATRLHALAGMLAAKLPAGADPAVGTPIVASDLLVQLPAAWQQLAESKDGSAQWWRD